MDWYTGVARPLLFRRDAESAHLLALRSLRLLRGRALECGPREVFGVRFPNPVGLAAGMDKDGHALRAWPALGFGFVEVGTVTRHPQPGNERPRMFRLRESAAVINRMGFNNAGAAALAARLARLGPLPVPLGISLGKSKVTPLEEAVADYVHSLRLLAPYAAYVAVNVSSPNTPGLRALQDRAALDELLAALRAETDRPILVKVAPDLTEAALGEVCQVAADRGIDGFIATNTTVARSGVAQSDRETAEREAGGLSGLPLHSRSVEVVKFLTTQGELPVIGVGGIDGPEAALRMVDAGAALVQLYTGFVYGGPSVVRRTVRALSAREE
ncbi:dihydroorotate dehydrogenase (quinone) [Virgisporangium aliadipatigenens]|uniref:Dihydroorotate dehydrogenase (quinone) n=1 Tax=Virgisporangium aliadipatigenens TaxID=741659 RepID=A0A8J3YM88_9ACTN|nr:quinone-dependent dihydroorotate dehydrogenase [Virgisporangium aliadipatigenens]GIJ47806.1 dihydroorotate dehydrogenase (quinone) [Virgisporangium aliadipatigenens]